MTLSLRPDLAFVFAALRPAAVGAREQAECGARVRDWTSVLQLAREHLVSWWVWRALPGTGVPDAIRAALQGDVRDAALRALAGARQLDELLRVLERSGVRALAYKGPAMAADVHGDVAARCFSDLDVLVCTRDRDRARRALLAAGYASLHGYSEREERFYARWEGVAQLTRGADLPVELHWRCQAPRYGGPQDPEPIIARARTGELSGASILVPDPEDLAVLLAVHGVKHAWSSLVWLADFAAAVTRIGFSWPRFVARADAWGVRRAVYCALLVADELLALVAPPALLAEARADARASPLARAIAARLRGEAAPDIGREATPRYDLQWLEGAWARARYLALAAALPTPQERRMVRLPDDWLPLAYPVRAWRLLRHALERHP